MSNTFSISCVIPVYNEEGTIEILLESLRSQTLFPDEIIIVDGGSTDNTVNLLRQLVGKDKRFTIIEAGRAMPGKGRNTGAALVKNEWIVFTDAGIRLDVNWLKNLVLAAQQHPDISIVYGNFSPVVNSLFERCAAISYVPPFIPGRIRTKSIVSCLLKKEVWEKAGGFPDWRASEDLVFMENAEKAGYSFAFAPDAVAFWHLRPDLLSTFRKFNLYSKYNVWAGRQRYWHYGVARQYLLVVVAIVATFLFTPYWLLLIPAWIGARAVKRIFIHRYEFGWKELFNPGIFLLVILIILTIDIATFSGWTSAIVYADKKDTTNSKI